VAGFSNWQPIKIWALILFSCYTGLVGLQAQVVTQLYCIGNHSNGEESCPGPSIMIMPTSKHNPVVLRLIYVGMLTPGRGLQG
jgi:hypothetical protein